METQKNLMTDQSMEEIDLRQLVDVLLRWKWMIALITLTTILVAGIISFFVLPPVYEAQTTLLVVQGEDKTTTRYVQNDLESVIGNLSRLPEMTIKTYVEQIKDPVLIAEVIKKLELQNDGYTVESLQKMIEAEAIKDTNLIEVRVQNTDDKLAKNITQNLTELLLASISKNTQEQMSKSVIFLQQQIDAVSKDLDVEWEKLKKLESRPRSVLYLEEERSSVINELTKYRSKYQDARINYDLTQAGLTELQNKLQEIPSVLDGATNPLYQSLNEQIAQKSIALAEYNSQKNSMQSYINSMEKKLDSVQIEITEKKNEQQVVERRIEELEKTYTLLSEKITQTQITKSVNLGETSLQVISQATLKDKPVKPNKRLNIAIAGALGIMMSMALAFVLEFLDNKVRTQEDIEKHLGLAVLGVIPRFKEMNHATEKGRES